MSDTADVSNKKNVNKRNMVNRSVVLNDKTLNITCINDFTKSFDCLKISILNKASRVSGEFSKVTLGPDAELENTHDSDTVNEIRLRSNKPTNGTSNSRHNITFSKKKILLENEVQRREKVKKVVEQKKQEMEKSQNDIRQKLSHILSMKVIQHEKETAKKLAQLEAEEEQLDQQQEIYRKNEIERRRLKESEEILKKIIPYRESFHAKWKDIATVSKACRDQKSATRLLVPHATKLKELSMQMECINEKARNGDLTPADVNMAELIVRYNDEVFQLFKADIDRIEALYEEEIAKRELELKKAEIEAKKEALRIQMLEMQNAAKIQEQSVNVEKHEVKQEQLVNVSQHVSEVDNAGTINPIPDTNIAISTIPQSPQIPLEQKIEEPLEYQDNINLKIYQDSQQFLKNYTAKYQEFVSWDATKKCKFECQKTLNITVNAISHVSREQLISKYEKLKEFLSGKGTPNISLNPQAEAFSKSLLAQKIIDQGDTTISSKLELAFPFAAIAVALWNDWPDFGELLLAKFRTKSPFFVPLFFFQNSNQSEEDYYKLLGCKYNNEGKPEKPEQFWKRLGGMMYLYASIVITKQRKGVNKPHPHGIGNAWRWLAATLNIEPRCDIADVCATLIHIVLEVTGNDLWKTYPNQFPKMLVVLNNVYYEKLKSFDSSTSAPISRLGDFLSKALETGSIPPPKGQLPLDFW